VNYRLASQAIIVLTCVLLIGYDVLPFASAPDHDTLSEVMRDGALSSSALPYGWGFLAGHFFVQWVPRRLTHAQALSAAAGLAFVVHLVSPPGWAAVLLGVAAGALLWPLGQTNSNQPGS
jgi:hypothetical protein